MGVVWRWPLQGVIFSQREGKNNNKETHTTTAILQSVFGDQPSSDLQAASEMKR